MRLRGVLSLVVIHTIGHRGRRRRVGTHVTLLRLEMRRQASLTWHCGFHRWCTHIIVIVVVHAAAKVVGSFVFMRSIVLRRVSLVRVISGRTVLTYVNLVMVSLMSPEEYS